MPKDIYLDLSNNETQNMRLMIGDPYKSCSVLHLGTVNSIGVQPGYFYSRDYKTKRLKKLGV